MNTLAMLENSHVEKSPLRRVSLGAIVYIVGTSGAWHDYKPTRAVQNYGIQVHHVQYDFPEVLECPDRKEVLVKELGYGKEFDDV